MFANHKALVYAAVLLLIPVVLFLDMHMPLGIIVWLFYLLPVLAASMHPRPLFPVAVAVLCTVLLWANYALMPLGPGSEYAAVNRALGTVTLFLLALLGGQLILTRQRAQTLFWIEQGRTEISRSLMGDKDQNELAQDALTAIVEYMGARAGVFYLLQDNHLLPRASYAVQPLPPPEGIAPGEGLVGEALRRKRVQLISGLPASHLGLASGTGRSQETHLLMIPALLGDGVLGVVELAFLRHNSDFKQEVQLAEYACEKLGVGLRSAQYRENLQNLLQETQRQGEELQAQAEELRVVNEELQEQSHALQQSQAQLETQQSELEHLNAELEERAQTLEQQRAELLETQARMQENAEALETASRYKSEFLANMSHELRTPLNSSLILSHMLVRNKNGNLTEEQVRYARTIHAANTDLLNLINDILDLSRIEAGHMQADVEEMPVEKMVEQMRQAFEPVAAQKSLAFNISVAPGTPERMLTDETRLAQILKNLLSNAFKFTQEGEVSLQIARAAGDSVSFTVTDTGIGIAEDQQQIIFEAFRQADGSTNRTYGGTGLGLSISRQLAHLLGGDISVASTPGKGSQFNLVVPRQTVVGAPRAIQARHAPASAASAGVAAVPASAPASPAKADPAQGRPAAAPAVAEPRPAPIPDDRGGRRHGRLLMAVEDDLHFAAILRDLANEMGFDFLHATDGASAEKLGLEYRPDAILLDVRLPDTSGLALLEAFKRHAEMRHVPVHMISVDDYRQTALELGAVGYSLKPVARDEVARAIQRLDDLLQRDVKRLLVVEDNPEMRSAIADMVGRDGLETVEAGTAAEALAQLEASSFDCVILDLKLPDSSGFHVLEQMAAGGRYSFPPVIIYTGRDLTAEEEQRLRRYSESIIVKGARSPERLLDEVSLFLHRVESQLPAEQRRLLANARQRETLFEGRKILLAEDDVRNVFALSSVFDPLGAELVVARNGREALEKLRQDEDIALVLMDIMMPEMDGLQAMRAIRAMPDRKNLPIIALTAKAMQNDRAECLSAGANDYIAKPLDVDKLVSLCRVWMPR